MVKSYLTERPPCTSAAEANVSFSEWGKPPQILEVLIQSYYGNKESHNVLKGFTGIFQPLFTVWQLLTSSSPPVRWKTHHFIGLFEDQIHRPLHRFKHPYDLKISLIQMKNNNWTKLHCVAVQAEILETNFSRAAQSKQSNGNYLLCWISRGLREENCFAALWMNCHFKDGCSWSRVIVEFIIMQL